MGLLRRLLNILFPKPKQQLYYHHVAESKLTLEQQLEGYKYSTASYIVVGYSHENEDGTSRQSIIKRCQVHDEITLKHVPMPDYPRAIQVWTKHGLIGYISEDNNNAVLNKMTKAEKTIARIRKFLDEHKKYKVVVIEVYYCKPM